MKELRRFGNLAAGGLVAVGLLVGLLMFVVLPAFATASGQLVPPPSTAGVTPTDVARGVPNGTDCSAFYANNPASQPAYSYYIADPEEGGPKYTTTVGGSTVTFTLKEDPPNTKPSLPAYANDKYLSFTSTGAVVTDVGVDAGQDENQDIKGVTDVTRYSYSRLPGGFVTADGYLHPPAESVDKSGNPTRLYSFSHVTFCFNLPTATVSGTVYRDANQNGKYDTGTDSAQSGWTVNLYGSGSTPIKTFTTTGTGAYTFAVPVSSSTTYRICEVPPASSGIWAQSQPGSGAGCTGSGEPANGYSFQATTPGSTFGPYDFGNAQFASISGTAFSDANGNGHNDNDTGLGGLTATLYDNTTGAFSTQPTGTDGTYSFANQVVGNSYTVCASSPTPGTYKQTLPSLGANCNASGQAGNGYAFTLGPSGIANQDFGFQPLGSISGVVYEDANVNGTYESGTDTAQSGWMVNLYDGSALRATTTSAGDGTYGFVLPLSTTTTYTVCEVPPSGTWAQSEPLPSSGDVCAGSNELPKGHAFTPSAQDETDTGNFGNVHATSGASGTIQTSGYQVQLANPKNTQFVINSGLISGKPFVSLWAGDATQSSTPMIEKFVWQYDPTAGQNRLTVEYTDIFPFNLSNLKVMPYCKVDPRDLTTDPSGLTLLPSYQNDANKGQVLPGSDTSCLILSTEATGTGSDPTKGTFTAYAFTDIDPMNVGQ